MPATIAVAIVEVDCLECIIYTVESGEVMSRKKPDGVGSDP